MKPLVALCGILTLASISPLAAETSDRLVTLEIQGSFFKTPEKELIIETIRQSGPDMALIDFQVWWLKGQARVETAAGTRQIVSLGVFPQGNLSGQDSWDYWRQKHGYKKTAGSSFEWLLPDTQNETLNLESGNFYDAYLKDIWSYWLLKTLPGNLKNGNLSEKSQHSNSSYRQTQKSVSFPISETGPIEPIFILFKIHLWTLPVQVFFRVHSMVENGEHPFLMLSGPVKWKFDMHEWRRLHGYQRTFWGSYAWDDKFPRGSSYGINHGLLLDKLLQKSIATWVNVAAREAVENLNSQLIKALQTP